MYILSPLTIIDHFTFIYPWDTILHIISANTPCGTGVETMAPNCSMCQKNNDTTDNSWCSGYCIFDAEDRICKERCKCVLHIQHVQNAIYN